MLFAGSGSLALMGTNAAQRRRAAALRARALHGPGRVRPDPAAKLKPLHPSRLPGQRLGYRDRNSSADGHVARGPSANPILIDYLLDFALEQHRGLGRGDRRQYYGKR